MLDPLKVRHVQRLLAQGGMSQHRIALLAGVARPTVVAIARGEHGRAGNPMEGSDSSRAVRCPGCGGLVFLPCRLCHVRAELRAKS
jgi:hypothetical protein